MTVVEDPSVRNENVCRASCGQSRRDPSNAVNISASRPPIGVLGFFVSVGASSLQPAACTQVGAFGTGEYVGNLARPGMERVSGFHTAALIIARLATASCVVQMTHPPLLSDQDGEFTPSSALCPLNSVLSSLSSVLCTLRETRYPFPSLRRQRPFRENG